MSSPWRVVQPNPIVLPSSPAADSVSSASSLDLSSEDFVLDMTSECSSTNSPSESRIRPHAKYYFRETNIQLVVEDVIYNVPRILLSQLSTRLQDLFAQPADVLPPGWIVQNTLLGERIYINYGARLFQQTRPCAVGPFTDARPLFNVTVPEFDAFLSVVIRDRDDYDEYKLDKDQWAWVLKLATLWDIPSIRALALRHLNMPTVALSPFERLRIARVHFVSEWLDDALHGLIQRAKPLTQREFSLMTDEDAALVSSSREQAAYDHIIPRHDSRPAGTPSAASSSPPARESTFNLVAEAQPPISAAEVPTMEEVPAEERVTEPEPAHEPISEPPAAAAGPPVELPPVEEPIRHGGGGSPGDFSDEEVDPPPPLPPRAFEADFETESEVEEPPPAPSTPGGGSTASRIGSKQPSRVPSQAQSRVPAINWGPAAPSVRAAPPASPPPSPKKTLSPQPIAEAGAGCPSILNSSSTSPGEEAGGFGLGGILGGAAKKASGWGWGGHGGGASGQTSPNPQQEAPAAVVPKRKMESTWGAAAPVAATRDSACGGGGGGDQEEEKADEGWGFGAANKGKGKSSAWGAMTDNNENSGSLGGTGWNDTTSFFDTLGSDPPAVADQLHLDTNAGASAGEAPISAVPSSALTANFSRLTTPPGERADGVEDPAAVEQMEDKKDEEEDDDWYNQGKKKKAAKGGTNTGTPAPAAKGKGKKGKR